jgi:pimeloyl-ACP methyl ester carboxylesterase
VTEHRGERQAERRVHLSEAASLLGVPARHADARAMGKVRPGAKKPGKPKDLEAADYRPSVRALRAAPPVGEIPAVVLSSDKCWLTFPGADAADAKATCPAWRAAQDQLATLLNAKHITDTNSGHFIQGEQPQLVTALRFAKLKSSG